MSDGRTYYSSDLASVLIGTKQKKDKPKLLNVRNLVPCMSDFQIKI